jgi:signal transduction histidine kinase
MGIGERWPAFRSSQEQTVMDPSRDGQDDPFRHTHELRTGLTGIKAHAQLLLRHLRRNGLVDSARLQHRAETIDQLTGRMTDAVSHIEDYFRRTNRLSNGTRREGE